MEPNTAQREHVEILHFYHAFRRNCINPILLITMSRFQPNQVPDFSCDR